MSRLENKAKTKSGISFIKVYIAYLVLIVVLLAALFVYVRGIMVRYENSNPEKYIVQMLSDGKSSDLAKFLEKNCFSDERGNGSDRRTDYLNTAASSDIKVKVARSYKEGVKVYNVFSSGKVFLTVGLTETGTSTKLGIINITEWAVDTAVLRSENSASEGIKLSEDGTYSISVSIPDGFTLLLDGSECKLSEANKSDIRDFQYVKAYVETPKQNTASIDKLYFEPEVSALNNGAEKISPVMSGKTYSFAPEFAATAEAEKLALEVVNPITIAETWSKFMTDDVGGASHGLGTVISECRLIKNSNLYERAYNWSRLTDINFVSVHTLKGFTNEKISNCIKYNDRFFSCDVYAEKNMRLKTGADRTDIFNNRMYFVYMEKGQVETAGWYLADMVAL